MQKGSIVAFKTINENWFTGIIKFYYDDKNFAIDLIIPIEPDFYNEDDQTVFYADDVVKIVHLEN